MGAIERGTIGVWTSRRKTIGTQSILAFIGVGASLIVGFSPSTAPSDAAIVVQPSDANSDSR
jgi:hypothetical protein